MIVGDRLTLSRVDRNIVWFAHLPERQAGRLDLAAFLAAWDQGRDAVAALPLSAALVGDGGDGNSIRQVFEIRGMQAVGNLLLFDARRLSDRPLRQRWLGDVTLFVDGCCWSADSLYGGWTGRAR